MITGSKLSRCTRSYWGMVVVVAFAVADTRVSALSFSSDVFSSSLAPSRNARAAACRLSSWSTSSSSWSRLWTSMSTVNLMKEEEEEEDEEGGGGGIKASSISPGPLAASTVMVTPVPLSAGSNSDGAATADYEDDEEGEEGKMGADIEKVTFTTSGGSRRTIKSSSTSPGPFAASTVLLEEEEEDVVVLDWDWERVAASVFDGNDRRPIVLFDGICNLCNGGVNFAMDHDPHARLRFCSLQSKVAQSLLMRTAGTCHVDQIVLVTDPDRAYFRSEAVARICQHLDGLPPLQWMGHVGRITPQFLREPIYQLISKHRYQFGETESCRLDFDGTLMSRFVSDPIDIADV